MLLRSFLFALTLTAPTALAAQGRRAAPPKPISSRSPQAVVVPPAAAGIEGDVYLLNNRGDVQRGAAGEVALVPRDGALDQAMLGVCAMAQLRPLDWDADRLLTAVAERAAASAARRSKTGMNAHYTFTDVAPGRYLLVSSMQLPDGVQPSGGGLQLRRHRWAVPATVVAGERMQVDLDNSNVDTVPVPCTIPAGK